LNTAEERKDISLKVLLPKRTEDTPVPVDVWERMQGLASLACKSYATKASGKSIVSDAQANLEFVLLLIKTMGCTKKTCGVDEATGKPWCEQPKHIYMHIIGPCIAQEECEGCEHCDGGVMTQMQRTAWFKGGTAASSATDERNK